MLFVNSARAIFTLAVISTSTPVFTAMIVPLAGVYYWVQRYYLRTSRELKRLDSVSRSPIYAHFQESLGGITTIRAYRQQARFAMENEWRVDANLRAYFPSINANRYVSQRCGLARITPLLTARLDGLPYDSSFLVRSLSSAPLGSPLSQCPPEVGSLLGWWAWPCRMPFRSPNH